MPWDCRILLSLGQFVDIALVIAATLLVAWPLGKYITRIFNFTPSRVDRFLNPIENAIYKVAGVDPSHKMGWKEYFLAALILNIVQMAISFIILTTQGYLPLNQQHFPGFSWDLALNTVVSFATNTNLQHYAGEASLSTFSQMTAIQFLQFTSATTGLCCGIAMVRALTAHSKDMGNFYVDFTRGLTRLFLPLCFIAAIVSVWLGTPQTLNSYVLVTTVQGATQKVLMGPVASLDAIMQLGTNGGGFYGANSAYPLQNPSPVSDVFQILLMLLIPTALCFVLGEYMGKKRESIPVIVGAYLLFIIDLGIAFIPTPILNGPGLETRFGGFMSTFWTVVTTAVTTGSVNSSLTGNHPLAIVAAFMGMFIQSTPGGKGVGLMYMVMYIVITLFIVGLMSGRTPEYLGMKITARDVKLVMVAFLIHPIIIIIPTLIAYASGAAAAIGYNGTSLSFTQILYEFTSSAANNGSDFLGTTGNTPFFNVATAIVIFLGRYGPIACLLAMGGSMIGRKRLTGETTSSIRTDTMSFSLILVASILILVVLTFFPFLALGPILAYLQHYVNFFGLP